MNAQTVLGLVLCLFLASCDDSTNPLSNPQTSKADEGLVGVWRAGNGKVYYHIRHAGEKFPKGVMRVVMVNHDEANVDPPEEYLAYSTILGNKTYLNVVIDEKQVKVLDAKGWKPEAVKSYTFLRYKLDGNKLTVWGIDETAKEKAIKSGKIKGVIEKDQPARFTDTSENVAHFIGDAGDGLWYTKEPELERVTTHQQEGERRFWQSEVQVEKQAGPQPPLRRLGSMFMVDKNGVIWNQGRPVGIWGVNGSEMSLELGVSRGTNQGTIWGQQKPIDLKGFNRGEVKRKQ